MSFRFRYKARVSTAITAVATASNEKNSIT
jgi:hypothetical protein